jgi:hypothetical protein
MSTGVSSQTSGDIETNGIKCEVYLCRNEGRWEMTLFAGRWIEQDLRRELGEGFVFAVDPDSVRAYGIPFVQLSKRYTKESE